VNDFAARLRALQERIAAAAALAGRRADEVRLLAVSKTFPVEVIREAFESGQRRFGENKVQEAATKIESFGAAPGPRPEWHLVGHLQSNKARRAAELFDVVHSVDSGKLARKLSEAAVALGKTLVVLIQIDLGGEETKSGAAREEVAEVARTIRALPGLRLDGLMTLPPYFDDPESARPFFRELREIAERLERDAPGTLGTRQLSMGMSHDFEIAISEGATLVRIGTALFGERLSAG
jgi:pyridoxal phosphate enzyme (YggS family)